MVTQRRYATFRLIHNVIPLGDIDEFFVEGSDAPIPTEVYTFVNLLKKLGRFQSGETLLVRMDGIGKSCEVIERRETQVNDVTSKKSSFATYPFE